MLQLFYAELLKRLSEREEGQDLAEYALLLFLIALVVVVALTALGPIIAGVYNQIAAAL
jgi:Flp pilus assembly pilin Flp